MKRLSWHWRMGRHSGFPVCCVTFYTAFWAHLPRWVRRTRPYLWLLDHEWDVQYVRCPLCHLTGRRVGIHVCHSGCSILLTKP